MAESLGLARKVTNVLKVIYRGKPYDSGISTLLNIQFIAWSIWTLPKTVKELHYLTFHNYW